MGLRRHPDKKLDLRELYYDPKYGFTSLPKFYEKVKEKLPGTTIANVKEFLDKQEAYQMTKEMKKPREFNSILAKGVGENYQMDILVYDRYEIHKYKYILVVIDVYSRYAACKALTNRSNEVLLPAIQELFQKIDGPPKHLNADNEFNQPLLLRYFAKEGIVCHFSDVGEINKNAIVERFNRTLAGMFQKWRIGTRKREWYKVLDKLVHNYNTTLHGTVKETPMDIVMGKKENRQDITFVDPDFEKGDKVRYKEVKKILGKGDYVKFSEDTYTIVDVKGKRYMLENDRTGEKTKRWYKDYELKKIGEIERWAEPEKLEAEYEAEARQKRISKRYLKEIDAAPEEVVEVEKKVLRGGKTFGAR